MVWEYQPELDRNSCSTPLSSGLKRVSATPPAVDKFSPIFFFLLVPELPSLLPIVEVAEALLHVHNGDWFLCLLVANVPDSFNEGNVWRLYQTSPRPLTAVPGYGSILGVSTNHNRVPESCVLHIFKVSRHL